MLPEIEKTIKLEGGYVNDPDDPGGETKFGISKRSYPHVEIASLTPEAAAEIYKKDFWDKLHLDSYTFKPFRWKLFDIAVNMGIGTASAFLLMLQSKKDTMEAVYELIELCMKRRANMVRNNPKFLKYLVGWTYRTFETGKELT